MKRIGVMGGTFDPVHVGHTSFAADAIEQAELDGMIFIPTKLQPFKLYVKMSDFEDRMAMLKIATADIKNAYISDLENRLEGVSYTYRTLEVLKDELEDDDKIFFLIGTDTFVLADIWKRSDILLSKNAFIVGIRPGYDESEVYIKKKEYEERYGTEVLVINNRRFNISATEIRSMAGRGESLDKLVHKGVEEYIISHGLYR